MRMLQVWRRVHENVQDHDAIAGLQPHHPDLHPASRQEMSGRTSGTPLGVIRPASFPKVVFLHCSKIYLLEVHFVWGLFENLLGSLGQFTG